MTDSIIRAIDISRAALEENSDSNWIIGFSGGKDSTALLKIFRAAAEKARKLPPKIDVIYCDTGVENPALDHYVKDLLQRMEGEFLSDRLPFRTKTLSAPVSERFFVKIVGRGYPPPTNSFRWCTKSLRIKPVSRFISEAADRDAIVALGMRRSESQQRDRSISQNGGEHWQTQNEGSKRYKLFLPILDLDVGQVWDAVFTLKGPNSVQPRTLERLYRGASGECPIIKSPQAAPCASGRFGCWTCTVVRRDRSAESLVGAGHSYLAPFLEFRNWLAKIRNEPSLPWGTRRNGKAGLGPFTLSAR
ncbi:MAG: phosphoadenosine phosphosulfate reductase, partial [Mesorhizobium sp.]|uniref:phosphoadenosine phosphosulfate reductase domain-containing protein n=1 Tax=Mesorhizobium sp. TaxID=1871066 RepID=UPI000FE81A56